MKANKFFLGLALIGAILTGCEKEPEQTGKYDTASYMSVSIAQVGGTRAATGTFVDGTADENRIEFIDFYFYENGGAPFVFTSAQNGAGGGFGGANNPSNVYHYTVLEDSITNNNGQNIDEIVRATLVIQHNTGNIPAYMIAVINPDKVYSGNLAAVKGAIIEDYKDSNDNHIMVNSVYKGADGSEVMATPITIDNLAINEENAKAKPVTIYVERTAARVQFSKTTGVGELIDVKAANGTDDYTFEYTDNSSVTVKAKILGWDIVTTAEKTTLAKKINTAWADNINGMAWNQPALYRSYWADATLTADKLNKQFSWGGLLNKIGAVDYCLENTTKPEVDPLQPLVLANGDKQEDVDVSRTNVTKVVVKAQLTNASGDPITIVNWFGSNYKTEGELKAAVAQSLKNEFNWLDGTTYKPIEAKHIAIVENTSDVQHSYEVYFQLSTDPTTPDKWYKLNNANTAYEEIPNPNTELAKVQKAKIWKEGMAYYIVNIRHFGTGEKTGSGLSAEYQEAYYGVVRNHAYDIKFNGVIGLGTPVYSATTTYPEPVTPDFTESYVAAEINVLAWHLVSHEVTLQ